jgi:hypothetical protein
MATEDGADVDLLLKEMSGEGVTQAVHETGLSILPYTIRIQTQPARVLDSPPR